MAKSRIIFAIGGGDLETGETLKIDREIVRAAKTNHHLRHSKPNALFIPTASGDDPGYYDSFKAIYHDRLGCTTDVLYLYNHRTSPSAIRRKIHRAHLVYVGGGSTPSLMRMWRKYSVDRYLRTAWQRGVVMAGLSAGANCWFAYGLSDAYKRRWTTVRCLGFVEMAGNVHYSSQVGRKRSFDKLVQVKKLTGIAIEDNVAFCLYDQNYRVLKAEPSAVVYRVIFKDGRIVRKPLKPAGTLAGLSC